MIGRARIKDALDNFTLLNELDTGARTVYGEARGEDYNGKLAVSNVLHNRVKEGGWYGDSLRFVCLKPYQFSCWLKNDPHRAKLEAVDYDDMHLRECLRAVLEAQDSQDDITYGANHYLVSTLDPKPDWYDESKITVSVGHHTFLKL